MATTTLAANDVTDFHVSSIAAIARSKMAQRANAAVRIPLTDARIWDSLLHLTVTANTDDLGIYARTFGTNGPWVGTGDLKAAGATTRYCRFLISIPEDYEATETVTIRCSAGMNTTVADTTATIDVEAYRHVGDGTVGSDLCATSATTINSTTAANKDFTITPNTLLAGDTLDVRITIAVNDAATGTSVIGALYALSLLADLR